MNYLNTNCLDQEKLDLELEQVWEENQEFDIPEMCKDCEEPLPNPTMEYSNGIPELVTYCACGATYITK